MNHYIILTAEIYIMGGMQSYVASKTEYLKRKGWNVSVFYPGAFRTDATFYKELNQYKRGGIWHLKFLPDCFKKSVVESVVKKIITDIGYNKGDFVVVESQNDVYSLWGELIANKTQGRNMCFICNELFREPGKYYEQYIDFFWKKYLRKELYLITKNSFELLFEKEDENSDKYVFSAANNLAAVDITYKELDRIDSSKINICYFGRIDKGYVGNICREVIQYVKKRKEYGFRLILVGNGKDSNVEEALKNYPNNLEVLRFNGFNPIPKRLFEVCDVFVAASGCAIIAFSEQQKVIIPDSETGHALGIYGYTIDSTIFGQNETSYSECIDDIVFNHRYDINPVYDKKLPNSDKVFDKHIEYIKNADKEKKYLYSYGANKVTVGKKTSMQLVLLNLLGNRLYDKVVLLIRKFK